MKEKICKYYSSYTIKGCKILLRGHSNLICSRKNVIWRFVSTPPPLSRTWWKFLWKFFCLSFSFRNMQVDSFASVSLALIIVQRESALNSLYQRGCPKQPSRGVFRKMCSENTQQIYRRTPMLKCDLLNSHFDMGVFL